MIWGLTATWIFDDSNCRILAELSPHLLYEILYSVYLNHEFMSDPSIQNTLQKTLKRDIVRTNGKI